jgi:ubiquinone/menaquinone biosynthesis C-methylase UbiE
VKPSFLPAASHDVLTPLYDIGSRLLGAGPRFKRRVVDAAGIVDGDRVLDLACGTGVLAVIAKQQYPKCTVIGADIDPRILDIARRRIAKAGVSVDLVCAPAERTGLDAASFDLVVSTLAFHHLPLRTKEGAVQEIVRLLRPGGAFLLVELVPRIRRRASVTEAQAGSPKWGFATNSSRTLRGLLSAAGMEVFEPPPPRPWVMAPWMYAVRGVKPR